MASAQQSKDFIATIAPIAIKVCKERGYGNAQVWTCIAQACCESNYGTSTIMKRANAFFGIKASQSWVNTAKYGGLVYNAATKECYDGKNYVGITAAFRAYRTMEDSVRDYFDLLENKRYKACLNAVTVQQCISAIKNGGYATSPTYISTIVSIYKKFQSLIEKYTVDGAVVTQPTQTNTGATSTFKNSEADILAAAKDVIAGKYGNGSARKKNLLADGFDPAAVQKKVNELLKK
jgi:flagellum-specific peptidoglycan hydrolase FlgJ